MRRFSSLLCAAALALTCCVPTLGAAVPLSTQTLGAPAGLLFGRDGTLYIADQEDHNILALEGQNYTLTAGHTLPAGMYELPTGGFLDGPADSALFNAPTGLTEWMGGIVVSDTHNHRLRLVKDGIVQTLAGTGIEGSRNGAAANSTFSAPMGLATDEAGNLYVADSGSGLVRKLTQKGQVSTYADGFVVPAGLCWYGGSLYLTDAGTNQIFKITDGVSQLIAGTTYQEDDEWFGGFVDGPALQAAFSAPQDILVTGDAIYVADTGNSAVRAIRDGRVTTLLEHSASSADLWPATPAALACDGKQLYVADSFAGVLYTLALPDTSFSDIPQGEWYFSHVTRAVNAGLMSGVGNGKFAPDATLTRGMMAVILRGMEQARDRDAILTGSADFSDVPSTSWYAKGVGWLTATGITAGYPDGRFGGEDPLTREQLATMLYQYAKYAGYDVSVGENTNILSYTDALSISEYAFAPMQWACGAGVLSGVGDGRLAPQGKATRAQAATMLMAALEAFGR